MGAINIIATIFQYARTRNDPDADADVRMDLGDYRILIDSRDASFRWSGHYAIDRQVF